MPPPRSSWISTFRRRAYSLNLDKRSLSVPGYFMESSVLQRQFSASVRLDLLINGKSIPLAKIWPGRAVFVDQGHEARAGEDAVVVLNVDGRETRWEIVLDHGIVPFDDEFTFLVKKYPENPLRF